MARLLVTTLVLILAGATVYFLILPQWEGIGATKVEIGRLQGMVDELAQLAERRDALRDVYGSISEEDRKRLAMIVPLQPDTAASVVDFEIIAQRNTVTLQSISFLDSKSRAAPLAPTAPQGYGTIPLSLSVRGTYESFLRFLDDLEHNLRVVDVTAIAFGGTTGNVVSASLNGVMFYRR